MQKRPSHPKRLRVLQRNKMERNQTPLKIKTLLAALLILALNFAGCKEEVPPPETVIPLVKTELVQADPKASNTKLFNAITSGIDSPTVSFRVSGTLETVTGKVGDFRKKGEILAALDPRDFKFKINHLQGKRNKAQADLDILTRGERSENILKLEAQLISLKSTFRTAKQEYRRVQQLYTNNAASRARLEKANSDRDLAEANYKATEQEFAIAKKGGRDEEVLAQKAQVSSINANLERAIADLSDTHLRMPFDGLISAKHISQFEEILKGDKIFDVVKIDRIELQISIPEVLISKIKKGMKIKTQLQSLPGRNFDGKITKVGLSADKKTLTYPVWVEIENPKREILPGMSGVVILNISGVEENLPLIPLHSILVDKISQEKYVFVYDPGSGKVARKNIKVASILGSKIVVTQGLEIQDVLITAGLNKIQEGMKVRITQKTKVDLDG